MTADEKRTANSAPSIRAKRSTLPITLFGQRMEMADGTTIEAPPLPDDVTEPRSPDGPKPEDEERRMFWAVAGVFAAVFLMLFVGLQMYRTRQQRTAVVPPVAAPGDAVVPPAAVPSGAGLPAAVFPTSRASETPAPPGKSRTRKSPGARKRAPDSYLERLRQERLQYERDRAQGRYREFPQ